MKHISVVVKPTLSCNINCRHCYHAVDDRSDEVMSFDTLERLICLSSEYESVWFIWHGGEPLVLPLKFYKNAIRLQEKYFGKGSHRISNTIQTNGTLIDRKFINFCKENKINVGVSSEGPCNGVLREITDDVNRNIKMMKDRGHIFSVNSTICSDDVSDQMNIYDHFREMGAALSFSPVIRSGSATQDMVPNAGEYAKASITVFDKWLYDAEAEMPLMPHLQYIMAVLGEPSESDCAHSSCITKWLSVYPNGDVYPCAKGCPSEFMLGNINDMEKMSDSFRSDALRNILTASIERRDKCMTECKLFEYCGGGCAIDALSEGTTEMNNHTSCKIFKEVFMHILNVIETILLERPDLSHYNKFVREAILGKLLNPKVINY